MPSEAGAELGSHPAFGVTHPSHCLAAQGGQRVDGLNQPLLKVKSFKTSIGRDQCCRTRHVGRGHGRATPGGIATAGYRRLDAGARRAQVGVRSAAGQHTKKRVNWANWARPMVNNCPQELRLLAGYTAAPIAGARFGSKGKLQGGELLLQLAV